VPQSNSKFIKLSCATEDGDDDDDDDDDEEEEEEDDDEEEDDNKVDDASEFKPRSCCGGKR